MASKPILITGAAGFLGTNLTLKLLQQGENVIGVDNLSRGGSEDNLAFIKRRFPKFRFEQKEIEDVPLLIARLAPSLVYHFAAQVAVTTSLESPRRDFDINGKGTFEIALAASEVGAPVIYSSTNKVFGDNVNKVPVIELPTRYDFGGKLKGKGIGETFPIDAKHHTPYGCSKLVGDIYVREFGGVVNRCSCMYGPNQHGIMDQGWVSYFAREKLLKRPAKIFGDGKQVRDILHIDDVVALLEAEGERMLEDRNSLAGEVFNVGGGYDNTISLLELCDAWEIKPSFGPWRPADQKVFYCDTSKARRVLGWKPKVGKEAGMKEIYDWTKQNLGIR